MESRHGLGGRLAYIFGKLVDELWDSDKSHITPKKFRAEFTSLFDQFAGAEQHDAQV